MEEKKKEASKRVEENKKEFIKKMSAANVDAVKKMIEVRFTYHAPKDGQPERYEAIRKKCKELASLIADSVPVSREQSTAFTKLEECCMWANAGIARNE